MRWLVLVPCLVLALAPLSAAHAQQCAEGRVSTPETLGRCCWPGQSFSETLGRCSGPPQCPAPFVAEGDSCVVPYTAGYGVPPGGWPMPGPEAEVVPSQPGARSADFTGQPGAPGELRWPAEPPALNRALLWPRLERGTDQGLLTAGLSIFLAGYVGGLILGGIDEAAKNCSRFDPLRGTIAPTGCESWPYAFIPVVGSVLAGSVIEGDRTCCRDAALGFAVGLPLALVQVFGLTLTALAVFGSTETLVPGRRGGEAIISVLPYATETEAGTWLRVEL